MKLYNTLTRQTEELKPLNPPKITLYTCGPTVYNYQHIGNMRAFLAADFLRRGLDSLGYETRHIMNITDVGHLVSDSDEGEDKLEKGAKREGKSVTEIAEYYTGFFKADIERLNVLPPNGYQDSRYHDTFARATAFIPEQIELVRRLLDSGYAYQVKQAIYFDVTKLADYGILTGQKLSAKETAVRDEVVTDEDKHHPQDFAIWFFTVGRFADHSMHWPSPWGEGFPGWHLECSAIIHETLGDPIDIHAGGIEHIGTHHPNEMAQTEAAFGHQLANIWFHWNHLLIDGAKMAKSVGNVLVLQDIIDRGYSPLAFRLLALQTHYRSEQNFTWEALDGAQATLQNLYTWADQVHQPNAAEPLPADWFKSIANAIADDIATPQAIAALFQAADRYQPSQAALKTLDRLFGLDFSGRPDITDEQKALIKQREAVRRSKDWSASDKLRDQLKEQAIGVRDTAAGPIWFRS